MSTDIATLATLDVAALVAWGKERLDAAGSGLEVQKVKATAAAVAAYQRAVGAGKEAQQGAVEITVRCERRLQQELKKLEKNKGAKGNPGGRGAKVVQSEDRTTQPTLAELGVDKRRASENSVLAEVTVEQFEAALDALRARGELTMEAARSTISQALAGGMSPGEIETSVKKRRGKPEQVKMKIDLSPAGSAIFDLEVNNLWTFDPADCARRISPLVRERMRRRACVCRDWLDRFIASVEELSGHGQTAQADRGREEAPVSRGDAPQVRGDEGVEGGVH